MNKYIFASKCIGWSIAIYFVIGLLSIATPKNEIFPFFSWFLFPFTPDREVSYALRIMEANGQLISPPRLHKEADTIISDSHSIILHTLIQNLAKAYQEKNIKQANQIRTMIERNYIRIPCRYELIAIIYDPIEQWKCHTNEVQHIETFTSQITTSSGLMLPAPPDDFEQESSIP